MGYIPFWKRPSWLVFVATPFKAKNYSSAFINLLNKMPQFFYPMSEQDYVDDAMKYGQETWNAPHNLFREIFHGLGGLFIGLGTGFIPLPYLNCLVMCSVLLGFGYLEFIVDIPEGKQWQKAILDLSFWLLGTAIGLYLCQ